jgi:hypothetical protein
MPVLTVIDEALEAIEEAVRKLPKVSATEIGLDIRAGYVYIDVEDECIIADRGSIRSLDYYGGFEYVDEDAVSEIGRFKVYSADSERVADALDYYRDQHDEDVA